jgi:alpha-aminoadipate carrier protein LysW
LFLRRLLLLANRQRFGLDILRVDLSYAGQRSEITTEEERKMPRGTCPECDAEVQVDEDTDKGDVVECSDCGTQLEVVGLDPIELDVAVEEEEEDWTE